MRFLKIVSLNDRLNIKRKVYLYYAPESFLESKKVKVACSAKDSKNNRLLIIISDTFIKLLQKNYLYANFILYHELGHLYNMHYCTNERGNQYELEANSYAFQKMNQYFPNKNMEFIIDSINNCIADIS